MDYEKRYKEANHKVAVRFGTNVAKEIFTDLYESEDEKIRKTIIRFFKDQYSNETEMYDGSVTVGKAIAWLEKQGEQKVSEYDVVKTIKERIIEHFDNHLIIDKCFSIGGLKDDILKIINEAKFEKQGEQKPIDKVEPKFKVGDTIKYFGERQELSEAKHTIKEIKNDMYVTTLGTLIPLKYEGNYELVEQKTTDKVKPKFKVGDWVVNNQTSNIYLVRSIINDEYCLWCPLEAEIEGFLRIVDVDSECHLWTIEDAKDGDVLVDSCSKYSIIILYKGIYKERSILAHCGWNGYNLSIKTNGLGYGGLDNTNYLPATKEQRDTLMKAMADAGWEFDFKKKALKKIHVIDEGKAEMDYCFTKMMNGENVSPIWSEEDEEILEDIRFNFAYNKEKMTDSLITQYNRFFDKIKSLKPQPRQEWSEEDEKRLKSCLNILQAKGIMGATETINTKWLKSLKQRIGG